VGALRTYAFINAKLRARIGKILPEEFFAQMLRTRTLDESTQMLRGTDFAAVEETYHRTGDLKSAELELLRREAGLYRELLGLVNDELRPFVAALAGRFETENLKNALRLWFDINIRGRNVGTRTGYLIRERIRYPLDVDAVVNAGTLEAAGAALAGTPYAPVLAREAPGAVETGSLFALEIALDQLFFRHLDEPVESLSPRDRSVARRIVGAQIDIENINWLIRFKVFYALDLEQALAYSIPRGLNLSRQGIAEAYASERAGAALSELVRRRYPELSAMLSIREQSSGLRGVREQAGSTLSLALIERVIREILLVEARRVLGGYPFTVGIILAYFILEGEETRRIMSLLNAKFYEWSEERIVSEL